VASGAGHGVALRSRPSFVRVVPPEHGPNVRAGLLERWHAAIFFHVAGPRIVSGEHEHHVAVIAIGEHAKVTGPAEDVLRRIHGVVHTEHPRGRRHQLHEPCGSGP